MPVSEYFANTYADARSKFLDAARTANAGLTGYPHPHLRGPGNEELAIDVARLGPADAEAALILISGLHGVEGFCGSGCQVGYLTDQLHQALPAGTATILVHALNPFGFAWLRRVNEDNIDLNRNFQDFSKPLPSSSAYEALHAFLVPDEWEGAQRNAADAALHRQMMALGTTAFQAAVSSGQYSRPSGLFYGGLAASWSNLTLRHILREHVGTSAKKLAILDLHSGLGPTAYGEPIYAGADAAGLERAKQWYGPEVTSMVKGTSASAVLTGAVPDAFRDLAASAQVTYVALEFGTRPLLEVLTALRADHWLHAVRDRQTPLREGIKRQIRDAFYVDTPAWKTAVFGRTADFVMRAGRGLSQA